MTRLLARIPSFCLGLALQVVAATVALKGSVVADDDFPVAPIEIVHGCDREIVDCRETVGDDVILPIRAVRCRFSVIPANVNYGLRSGGAMC